LFLKIFVSFFESRKVFGFLFFVGAAKKNVLPFLDLGFEGDLNFGHAFDAIEVPDEVCGDVTDKTVVSERDEKD
jgi:hypothetical protein